MQLYQLDYLISPELSEQDAKALEDRIKSLVQEKQGAISNTESIMKIALAYEIKKFKEAFLAGLTFSLEPEKAGEIEKGLESEKNIIRHLMFKKKIVKQKARIKKSRGAEAREKAPKAKVELKEIEKKLEEILGE